MVGHTQTARDRPFIISIQAAQTGLEAWGSTRKGSLFIWDVKCLVTCWHFPWQQQRLLSPHILSALGTTEKFITVDNTTKGKTLRRGDRLNLAWYFCSGCLKLLSKGNNTQRTIFKKRDRLTFSLLHTSGGKCWHYNSRHNRLWYQQFIPGAAQQSSVKDNGQQDAWWWDHGVQKPTTEPLVD